jgi:hypothetical protein
MNSKRLGIAVGVLSIFLAAPLPPTAAEEAKPDAAAAPQTPTQPTTASAGQSATAPEATAAAASPATAPPPDVVPGPLVSERQALFDHIQQAGRHGIGTASYKLAFKAIEEEVTAGATEQQIKPRVDQLTDALKEQLIRAQALKNQRPAHASLPPVPTDTASAPPRLPPSLAGLASGANGALINKIKDQLGGSGMPSSDMVEKFLSSDQGKALLKKLGQ